MPGEWSDGFRLCFAESPAIGDSAKHSLKPSLHSPGIESRYEISSKRPAQSGSLKLHRFQNFVEGSLFIIGCESGDETKSVALFDCRIVLLFDGHSADLYLRIHHVEINPAQLFGINLLWERDFYLAAFKQFSHLKMVILASLDARHRAHHSAHGQARRVVVNRRAQGMLKAANRLTVCSSEALSRAF